MIKGKVILLACFVVTFVAGTTAGLVAGKSERRPHGHSWLMTELNLTAEQRDQMHKIWSEVREALWKQQAEQRKAIAEERDKAIAAILTPDQQPRYEQILQDYSRKVGELPQQRTRALEQAVERTKEILTPEQAAQYEELRRKQREKGFGGPRSQRGRPSSRPSTE